MKYNFVVNFGCKIDQQCFKPKNKFYYYLLCIMQWIMLDIHLEENMKEYKFRFKIFVKICD